MEYPAAAAIARTVTGWAPGPHLRLAGGTGPSYPSLAVEADSGRSGGSRWRGVLALYASPHGGPPALEVRVKVMCRTPPYNRQQYRSRLTAGLHALGIPRLDREADLSGLTPRHNTSSAGPPSWPATWPTRRLTGAAPSWAI